MRGDPCGGHGKDANGAYVYRDDCDRCHGWDWVLYPSAAQETLAKALHTALRHRVPADSDESYDDMKSDWRLAGEVLEDWEALGWTAILAPSSCARCGEASSAGIHHNIRRDGNQPNNPDQHPFAATVADLLKNGKWIEAEAATKSEAS